MTFDGAEELVDCFLELGADLLRCDLLHLCEALSVGLELLVKQIFEVASDVRSEIQILHLLVDSTDVRLVNVLVREQTPGLGAIGDVGLVGDGAVLFLEGRLGVGHVLVGVSNVLVGLLKGLLLRVVGETGGHQVNESFLDVFAGSRAKIKVVQA